jgi:hypothetical protein
MEPIKNRIVFALVQSTLMVTVLTFVLGPLCQGFPAQWPRLWLDLWWIAWPVAGVAIFFLAPLSRRLTARIVAALE